MKLAYVDSIADLQGADHPTPVALFDAIRSRLPGLPFRPDAVVFTSVTLYSEFMYLYGHAIAHELGLRPDGDIFHLTGGCFVGLQGLQIAESMARARSEYRHILVVAIDFLTALVGSETIRQRASAVRWGNGAALVLLSREADGPELVDFQSQTDHAWYDDFSIGFSNVTCAQQLNFKLDSRQYADFGKEDLEKAVALSEGLLRRQGVGALQGLVALNRGGQFSHRLGERLGLRPEQVFESFSSRGHLGSADIFMNLSDLMHGRPAPGHYLIYSCGYGYTRIAGIFRISQ
jgi:3-oxoacyl-[acyl-carrier-protein] synthase III